MDRYDTQLRLIASEECWNKDQSHLTAFTLQWQQVDSESIFSQLVGPKTPDDICFKRGIKESQWRESEITRGIVHYDDYDVHGVQLMYNNGDILTIGSTTDEDGFSLKRLEQFFRVDSRFIGFFGAST